MPKIANILSQEVKPKTKRIRALRSKEFKPNVHNDISVNVY